MLEFEEVLNPHILIVHTRKRLTDSSILDFSSKDWNKVDDADESSWFSRMIRKLIGGKDYFAYEMAEKRKNAALLRDLFQIEGITGVVIFQYSINLHKGHLFEWNDLRPQITEVLQKHGLDV